MFICTKENPYIKSEDKNIQVKHPDAFWIRDSYDPTDNHDDYEIWQCPNCGLTFYKTIPN